MSALTPGRRFLLIALGLVVVVLVVAQLFPPAETNPPETPDHTLWNRLEVAPAANEVLERACVDCHSNRTRWPRYARIAPGSWLIAHDVDEGRGDLNLSEWSKYPAARQQKLLGRMCAEAKEGDMPPFQYLLIHRDAKLTPANVDALCAWTEKARASLAGH